MWVTNSSIGGSSVLQEFNAETHAFRLPALMMRDKGSLFLAYPGAVPLIWAELVWVVSSAGGKPVLFPWQWCPPESSAEMMTRVSMWCSGVYCLHMCLVLCKKLKSNLVYTGLSVWGNLWSGWELCVFNWANVRQEKSMFAVPLCFAFAGYLTLGDHGHSHSDISIHAQHCALTRAISSFGVMSLSTMGFHPAPLVGIHRSAGPGVCCANLHQPGCGVQNESCCWCSPKTCFQRAHVNSALLLALGKLFSVPCFKMNLEQQACFV